MKLSDFARELGWIVWLIVIAVSLLAAFFFGIAGAPAAGRYFAECRGIPLSELHFTSDCEDAFSLMMAGVVVLVIGVAAILISIFRRRHGRRGEHEQKDGVVGRWHFGFERLAYAIHFDPIKDSVLFQRLLLLSRADPPMPIDLLAGHERILLSAVEEAEALLKDDFIYENAGATRRVVLCGKWVFPQ